jgi:hydroxymethylpyrimidine/phosphomethylpyrimidine kinase
MSKARPYCISFAGFDPSAGAGVLADIKTFEQHNVYGLGVCTAITYQNDTHFENLNWLSLADIKQQACWQFARFNIVVAKIGLVESLDMLEHIVDFLRAQKPHIRIIVDPIFKASAGFSFHETIAQTHFERIATKLYLVTPNWNEIQRLYPNQKPEDGARILSKYCHVYLKGGHCVGTNIGRDTLYTRHQTMHQLLPSTTAVEAKHGSGCVLSAALASNIANGHRLLDSCLLAKDYITQFLGSNNSLLGYHANKIAAI